MLKEKPTLPDKAGKKGFAIGVFIAIANLLLEFSGTPLSELLRLFLWPKIWAGILFHGLLLGFLAWCVTGVYCYIRNKNKHPE